MDDSDFSELWDLYENRLRLLANPTCQRCDAIVRRPLAVWHVGRQFSRTRPRVLFVGKPHRGVPGEVRPSGVIDPRGRIRDLRREPWPYWSYTALIAQRVFGDAQDPWEHIALTNLVKCTNVAEQGGSADKTTETMVRCCVGELGVLPAEIALLKPTHVVFYTAGLYPRFLESLQISPAVKWRDVVAREWRPCGRKRLSWREREAETSWCFPMRALITGHPERMQKDDFTRMIADWIVAA
jgi:hypothetical protein